MPGTELPGDLPAELLSVIAPEEASTFLFVPGDRPDRFDKAAAAGADQIILDLEDAVRDDNKDEARTQVAAWLAGTGRGCVRINAATTSGFDRDVATLRGAAGLQAVVLPMADDPQVASDLHAALGVPVIALVETGLGLIRSFDIAAAVGVWRLALGALDLAADLGTSHPDVLNQARAQLVISSSASGLRAPLDSPEPDVSDPDTAGAGARDARSRGMGGKLCIHPRQVRPVAAAFDATPEEVEWARRVIQAAGAGGVSVVDGMMVDAPVLKRAQALLQRSNRP